MDRNESPCWHAINEVGSSAFKDCVGIKHFCYILLRHYFSDDSNYLPTVHEFWNYIFTLALGLMMEFESTLDFRKEFLNSSTMVWYKINTIQKSDPAFILPI